MRAAGVVVKKLLRQCAYKCEMRKKVRVTERLQCKESEKGGESVCGKSKSNSKSKSKIRCMREDIFFVYVVGSGTSCQ